MSTTNGGPQPQMAMPQIGIITQYVKDFSFENPHAPRSLAPSTTQPNINIQINVDAAPMSETDFEVSLRLEGKAESQDLVLYSFELIFGGVFRIQTDWLVFAGVALVMLTVASVATAIATARIWSIEPATMLRGE